VLRRPTDDRRRFVPRTRSSLHSVLLCRFTFFVTASDLVLGHPARVSTLGGSLICAGGLVEYGLLRSRAKSSRNVLYLVFYGRPVYYICLHMDAMLWPLAIRAVGLFWLLENMPCQMNPSLCHCVQKSHSAGPLQYLLVGDVVPV